MWQASNRPIGIFDSGIGGLTVYRALKVHLPGESFIYLGDTARLPYGTKSEKAVIRFSIQNTEFLLKFNIKALVVACNTASSLALEALKERFRELPIFGVIEPGAKLAVSSTRNGKIGIIGTEATVRSSRYEKIIKKLRPDVQVFKKACPLFVPLVEEGWIKHRVTYMVAEEYLKPLRQEGIDTLILGCTHYPVLKEVIEEVMGDGVRLIESGEAVALELEQELSRLGLLASSGGEDRFFVTDFPQKFSEVATIFLGKRINNISRVEVGPC